MKVSITSDFDINAIYKQIDGFVEKAEQQIVDALIKSGKSFVDKARRKTKSEGGFNNITWNLRSSIGFVIVKDHQIIYRYFPPIIAGTEGNQTGLAYAEEIALLTDDGSIMLIVVAGMDYATLVEAKGKDVITGSSMSFEQEFLGLIR